MSAATDVQRAFHKMGYSLKDQDATNRCRDAASQLGLSSSDMASHYMTWAFNKGAASDVTAQTMTRFLEFVHSEHEKENKRLAKSGASVKPLARSNVAFKADVLPTPKRPALSGVAATPTATTPPPSAARSPLATGAASPATASTPTASGMQFAMRQNRGQVVQSFNPHLPAAKVTSNHACANLTLVGDTLKEPHLHMMDTIDTKIFALDERLMDFASECKRAMLGEADDVDRNSVAAVTQEPAWVVGRIVAEGEVGLNEASVLLEGSREASSGARVRLDLSALTSYRIFPGQSVCVKGVNPTGATFVAHELFTHLPSLRPVLTPAAAAASTPANGGQRTAGAASTNASQATGGGKTAAVAGISRDVTIVVAAGPYTLSDNVAYEPLQELLKHCSERQPDVLLLLGPFVDIEHPAIKSGLLDRTYEELFRTEVLSRVATWQRQQEGPQAGAGGTRPCRVAVMPAARDVHSAPVFPQPPMALSASAGGSKICSLSNPATFLCEGVTVSAVTHDVLKNLSGAEISRGGAGERLAALAGHIVGQRSLYPVYPPELGSLLNTGSYCHLQLPATPDILLLPSDLTPFVKVIAPPAVSVSAAAEAAAAAASPAPLSPRGVSPASATRPAATTGAAATPSTASASSTPGPASSLPAATVDVATLAINPGRVARGTSGGTFAHMTVLAGAGDAQQQQLQYKVEIVRV